MKFIKRLGAVVLAAAVAWCILPSPAASAAANPNGSAVARQIMDEGMVLLKNQNNALPLTHSKTIALFGESQVAAYNNSVDTLTPQNGYIAFGAGSAKALGSSKMVAPLDAFREAQSHGEITLFEELSQKYEANPKYIPDEAMYNAAAAACDTAVVFIRRWVGECIDMKKEDWYLSTAEKQMLTTLTQKFTTVIAVLNTPAPIDTSWAVGDVPGIDIDAVLFAGYGGAQGGYGIADVLLGKVNPSGKLVDTYAKDLYDYPTTETFFSNSTVEYREDIFLGYRYFETFDPTYSKVNYEFGFGLSYTDFTLTTEDFSSDGETATIKVKVKNTGAVSGKETVQVYFSAPQKGTGSAKLSKAAKELCAFEKTKLLPPGAEQTLTLTFAINDMAQYDDTGAAGHKSAYILEAGEYGIFVGNSIKDAGTRRAGTIVIDEVKVIEQLTEQCSTNLNERLTADGTYESLHQSTPESILLEAGGTLTVEAENYISTSSSNQNYKPTAESFSGYLYQPETGSWEMYAGKSLGTLWPADSNAVYQIKVEEAGVYAVTFRVASNSENNSFDVLTSTDGNTYTSQNLPISMPNTYALGGNKSQYFSFMDISGYALSLQKGTNYIKIAKKVSSTAPNIDSFTLSGDTIFCEAENFIEADSSNNIYKPKKESFTGYLYNAAANSWQAYSGEVLAQMWPAGSYAIYQIHAPKDGIYGLTLRVASNKDTSSNSFGIAVAPENGNFTTKEISIQIPNTNTLSEGKSQYHSYIDTQACAVELHEGINYIKIFTLTTSVPNIDSFTFTLKKEELRYAAAGYLSADSDTAAKPKIESFSDGCLRSEPSNTWESYSGKALASMYGDGAYAVYALQVPQTGQYSIRFRIASGRDNADNSFDIALSDDNSVYTPQNLSIAVPNTAALSGKSTWHSYIDTQEYTISLQEGINYLKILRKTTAIPNIESFVLSLQADTPGAAPQEPEQTGDIIKLEDVSAGRATLEDFTAQMTTAELATFFVSYRGAGAGEAGGSDEVCTKYGIKRINMYDGPSGLGSSGTSWPCQTIVACTWNVDLASAMGLVIGAEGYVNRVDLWLAPGLNLHRNPLAGRNFEYYSEDPYLTAVFGTAVTKAAQSMGLGVCIKHFVCNEKEAGKLGSDSRVSERALRELYLYPFEKTVKEAKPLAVMSSYNILNGIAVSENASLLTNILRGEWGFEGFVSGDWNNNKNAVAEVNAGNTVRQPASMCNIDDLLQAIQAGKIARETLEAGAQDILYSIMRMRAYYTTVNLCGGNHTFTDGICTRCHCVDETRISGLNTILLQVLDDSYSQIVPPSESSSPKDAGDISLILLLAMLTACIGGTVLLLIKKRNVCNR